MALKRIAFLTFLLWLVIPDSAFGQIPEWLYVSPSEVYQAPEDPYCYTITVGGGEYMTVNLEYYYEGGGPYYVYGWPSLDGNGQAQVCVDSSMPAGIYQFTGVQNSQYPYFFTPIYATLTVYPASRPSHLWIRTGLRQLGLHLGGWRKLSTGFLCLCLLRRLVHISGVLGACMGIIPGDVDGFTVSCVSNHEPGTAEFVW